MKRPTSHFSTNFHEKDTSVAAATTFVHLPQDVTTSGLWSSRRLVDNDDTTMSRASCGHLCQCSLSQGLQFRGIGMIINCCVGNIVQIVDCRKCSTNCCDKHRNFPTNTRKLVAQEYAENKVQVSFHLALGPNLDSPSLNPYRAEFILGNICIFCNFSTPR